ncbi:hypothetical protein [Streptomyces scabiei]|uniref:hypothetical protein n=1 Tax=Streptomyces scabiei TaxID=1930 RepID=UPI000A6E91CD
MIVAGGTNYAPDPATGYRAPSLDPRRLAHAAGVCVVGATVGPFKGWYEWDAVAEGVRQEVNALVRAGGEFDAVADFDRVLHSPYDHERILPFFDNGDHLHPNDTGMNALADAVPIDGLSCDRRARE